MVTENETYRNFCPVCGYESKEVTARLRREDMQKHRESLHPISDDASPPKGLLLESAGTIQSESGLSDPALDVNEQIETASSSPEVDQVQEESHTSPTPLEETINDIETEPLTLGDGLDTETSGSGQDSVDEELGTDDQDQTFDDASDTETESEDLITYDLVSEPSGPVLSLEEYEEESADSPVLELAPSLQSNRNLLISPWAVFCVGIGECGTKLSATMNKKPRDFASRHPVFYPVHCSSFDTHASITATLDDDIWKSANRMPLYPVGSPKLDPSVSGMSTTAEMNAFMAQAGGIGGIPYFGYLAFQQLFENDGNRYAAFLEDIEHEYFRTDLWNVAISQASGSQEPQIGGAIENVGLVTFNSARGGTGSGGTPVIHRFFADKCSKYGTNLALSLNVSVLPTDTEKATKPQFAKHAVACFHRLRNLTPVHGVLIVSNERLETVLGAGNYLEENSIIQEMLTPLVVSPSAKYTETSATATVDQNDIRRYIWNEMGNDKWPGLCTIGMAERPLSDFEVDELGAAINYDRLLENLVETASDQTTSEWESRPGETKFIAFLIAPEAFFGRRPFGLTRVIQNKILDESDLRREASSRNRQFKSDSVTGGHNSKAMLGNVALMNLDTSTTVKVVILYSNVRIRTIDELVEEGLGRELSIGKDGWDEIGSLTQSQVDQLEIEQLSNSISRESAESIITTSGIGRPYPFQR